MGVMKRMLGEGGSRSSIVRGHTADKVDIEWLAEDAARVRANLRSMSHKIAGKGMRNALRRGANLVKAEAILRAPIATKAWKYRGKVRTPGTLRQAIVAQGRYEFGELTVLVGVTAGPSAPHDAFYARFLELGTAHMSGREFMQPALLAKHDAAQTEIAATLRRFIKREVKAPRGTG